MLDKIYATRQTARFRALEPLLLPEYKGSTFRGALGHAFRKVSCPIICRDNTTCLLRYRCAYSVCFETPVPKYAAIMRKAPFAPHPFVLTPPADPRRQVEPGEEFEVELVLIGRGNDYVAHFIYAFDELGSRGLGRGRGKAELIGLNAEHDGARRILYDKTEQQMVGFAPVVRTEQMLERCREISGKPLRIEFKTPIRVKRDGTFTKEPSLENLMPSLLRRLHSLEYFHCDGAEQWEVLGILETARGVRMRQYETRWQDIERYSNRQERHMQLGGFVGWAEYDPVPDPLLPFLAWGEFLHVGKASAFGLGKFELRVAG